MPQAFLTDESRASVAPTAAGAVGASGTLNSDLPPRSVVTYVIPPGKSPASSATTAPPTTLARVPCPASDASRTVTTLPPGWHTLGATAVTAGGDPGGVCIQSSALYWGGITVSQVPGMDYTVEAQGRLAAGQGWGLAARVTVASDGTVSGHAVQYDAGSRGYRDVDYPGDSGPTKPAGTDSGWHNLAITVHGDHYLLRVDGEVSGEGARAAIGKSRWGVRPGMERRFRRAPEPGRHSRRLIATTTSGSVFGARRTKD